MDESLINRYLTFKNSKIALQENLKKKIDVHIKEEVEMSNQKMYGGRSKDFAQDIQKNNNPYGQLD